MKNNIYLINIKKELKIKKKISGDDFINCRSIGDLISLLKK